MCARSTPAGAARRSPSRRRPRTRSRGGAPGPGLLAHVLFAKYGLHLPLTRQSATYAREGIELDVSTLADWVGASAATLMPLVEAIGGHVFAAERLHADDTTVPVLDVGRTRTGRLWAYVRDDRPFAGADPPAAASALPHSQLSSRNPLQRQRGSSFGQIVKTRPLRCFSATAAHSWSFCLGGLSGRSKRCSPRTKK